MAIHVIKNQLVSPCQDTSDSQTHVHEFEGSTKLAETGADTHNHRFAGVTGEVVPRPNGRHVHALLTNTDFFDHHHDIGGFTELDTPIPNSDKHVHLVQGTTSMVEGHVHDFIFTTLINSPLEP